MPDFEIFAFFIFLVLSFLVVSVIVFILRKAKKFIQHVIWMRRRAGGTLAEDAEAHAWAKLIDRPDYRPVWRWYYAEKWKDKWPPQGGQDGPS